jgi:squalene synthase HpnC
MQVVRRATRHYENFMVVSFRQPRRIKSALASVYAYCRYSDDLADETEDPNDALALLDQWEHRFLQAIDGNSDHPILEAVSETIHAYDLPIQPFRDLLVAFRQDQKVHRYQTFQDLLGYCQFSANPVGRIVLALFGCRDERFSSPSDAICTGLQLANFWQDIARDAEVDRIYVPLEDLVRCNVEESDILAGRFSPAFRELMIFQVERARMWFEQGKVMTGLVGGNLRWEIEMFRRAGIAVLDGIRRVDYNVFQHRPTISWLRKVLIAISSLPVIFQNRANG